MRSEPNHEKRWSALWAKAGGRAGSLALVLLVAVTLAVAAAAAVHHHIGLASWAD